MRQGLRPWNPESALRKALAKSQETATTTKQGNNNKNKGEHRMAIYHSRVTTFSRANNHSSLAAAAYRAAILLVDQRTGKRHDYRRKRGVVETVFMTPEQAPDWALCPEQLWAAAEEAEKRKNATVAREFEIALPHELSDAERKALVKDIGHALIDRYGFAVQASTHAPSNDERNHHVHMLVTTRRMTAEGLADKTRELDGGQSGSMEVKWTREMISGLINEHLAHAHIDARVDPRKLEVQAEEAWARGDHEAAIALARRPVRRFGKNGAALERKGVSTEISKDNAKIRADNAARFDKAMSQIAQIKHPRPHAQEARRRQRRVQRKRLAVHTDGIQVDRIGGAHASDAVDMLGGAESPEPQPPTAEEAWSLAQALWNQDILPVHAASMPQTAELMVGMAERVRTYLRDNALPQAVKELLRRLKALKRRMDVPAIKKKAYQKACDLLDRAQWALTQVNQLNPTGRDVVLRFRRVAWVKHNLESVAAAEAALSPERVREDDDRIVIGTAEVELWSRHMLNRFPIGAIDVDTALDPEGGPPKKLKPSAPILKFPPPFRGGPK
ncbi:MobA/MobL family protein [Lysobacter enzymogenes]|nr:MobA/MobL family protein [Lysobacter enzymogenes]